MKLEVPDNQEENLVINLNLNEPEQSTIAPTTTKPTTGITQLLLIAIIVLVLNQNLATNLLAGLQLSPPLPNSSTNSITLNNQANSTTTCKPPTAKKYGNYKPKDMGKAFFSKVKKIACRLEMPPEYLLAIMGFETGGRFSPSYQNRLSGATGLIQFMPKTAESLGTSIKQLKHMSPIQQLNYVEKYFLIHRNSITKNLTLNDAYLLVLYPSAVKKGDNDHIFKRRIEYAQNKGLDINKDGKITKVEAGKKVEKYLVSPGFFNNY